MDWAIVVVVVRSVGLEVRDTRFALFGGVLECALPRGTVVAGAWVPTFEGTVRWVSLLVAPFDFEPPDDNAGGVDGA